MGFFPNVSKTYGQSASVSATELHKYTANINAMAFLNILFLNINKKVSITVHIY